MIVLAKILQSRERNSTAHRVPHHKGRVRLAHLFDKGLAQFFGRTLGQSKLEWDNQTPQPQNLIQNGL
jgi:hypothetical protein